VRRLKSGSTEGVQKPLSQQTAVQQSNDAFQVPLTEYISHRLHRGNQANSTIFLPRDAMHKHNLCRPAVSVCLSVRPSRSCIVSKRVNIFSDFSLTGSHAILVFPYQTLCQYADVGVLTIECRWVWKNRDSQPICRFISEIIQAGAMVILLKANRNLYACDLSNSDRKCYHFQWSRTTPNPNFKVTPLFDAEYIRNGTR